MNVFIKIQSLQLHSAYGRRYEGKGIQDEFAKIMGKHNRQMGAEKPRPSTTAHVGPFTRRTGKSVPLATKQSTKNCSNNFFSENKKHICAWTGKITRTE